MKLYFLAILKPTTKELDNLLDADSTCINTADSANPRTLLSFAAALNKTEMMVSLLAHGADINAINIDGSTALIHAARNDKAEALNFLLEWHAHPADPLLKDHSGKTCLHYTKPASNCLFLLLAKMTKIANEHTHQPSRIQAARMVKSVLLATSTELLAQIGDGHTESASLEASMSASLAALGFGHAGKKAATEFFAPARIKRLELADATRDVQLFAKSLLTYLSVRPPLSVGAASTAGSVSIPLKQCIIAKGDVLIDKLDAYVRSLPSKGPDEDIHEYRLRLAEMGILAEFLTQLRTYDDLEEAFTTTYSKYETHIAALDPRSEVAVFFAEHGLSHFARAGSASTP